MRAATKERMIRIMALVLGHLDFDDWDFTHER